MDVSAADPVLELSQWLEERELMHRLIYHHLLRAQERMKKQADKFRSERQFGVGDFVYLNLQPYIQSSVSRRAYQKLAFKFFGPYRVLEHFGKVAYHLELPTSALVHPMFHVSQLKLSTRNQTVSSTLPTDLVEFQVPLRILQRCWSSGPHPVEQVLVEWSHMPASLATWEPLEYIK